MVEPYKVYCVLLLFTVSSFFKKIKSFFFCTFIASASFHTAAHAVWNLIFFKKNAVLSCHTEVPAQKCELFPALIWPLPRTVFLMVIMTPGTESRAVIKMPQISDCLFFFP